MKHLLNADQSHIFPFERPRPPPIYFDLADPHPMFLI